MSLKEQLTPRELLDRFRQLTSEDATSINVDRQKLAGLRQRVHYDSYREFVEQYGSRAQSLLGRFMMLGLIRLIMK